MRLLPFFLFFSAAAVSSPTAAPPPRPALPPSTAFHLTDSLCNNKNNLVPLCLCHCHCPRPYSSLNYLFSGPYFMLLLLLLWVLRFSLLLWKTVGGGYSSWSHSSLPWPSSSPSSSSSSVARGRFVKRNSLSSFFSYFRFLSLLAAYLHCCCCCCVAEKVARLLSAISLLA